VFTLYTRDESEIFDESTQQLRHRLPMTDPEDLLMHPDFERLSYRVGSVTVVITAVDFDEEPQ
jgi:hypothetical protein